MFPLPRILLLSGSVIILGLGIIHLLYTFFTSKLSPRDPGAESVMRNTLLKITRETTLWKTWIGFNASHSLGAIFFGVVNLLLVTQYYPIVAESIGLLLINSVTLLFYLFLARKYWFRIPLAGILLSTICFFLAYLLIFVH